MRAIADGFFAAGANVVLPLLPAHGLVDPDEAMEDGDLDRKWVASFDHAVDVAEQLGGRISLGGFSTGGTLSVHKALRDPERSNGGLFLYAAALGVGSLNENLAWSAFAIPQIAKWQDGHYEGRGSNPYKYPAFPQFGALELIDLIHDINRMIDEGGGPPQPIFAVHSIDDAAAMPQGVGQLLRAAGVRGVGIVVASNPPLEHARLTLAEDIELDPAFVRDGESPIGSRAFPGFETMMDLTMIFFEKLPRTAVRPAEVASP
jgi:pimeloyl-ACP methyl ester carboxylesterase